MASVKAARYTVKACMSDAQKRINDFLSKEEALVIKRSKKSEKTINLRPLVYELCVDPANNDIEMLISSGSTDNIKHELVMSALFGEQADTFAEKDLIIKRLDQYTIVDGFVSLDDIGQVIK